MAREKRSWPAKSAGLMQEQYQMMQNLSEEVRGVERQFADYVVTPMIDSHQAVVPRQRPRAAVPGPRAQSHSRQSLRLSRRRRAPQAVPPQLQAMVGADGECQLARIQGQRRRGQQPDPDGAGPRGGGAHLPQSLRQHRSHRRPMGPARHQFHPNQGGQPAARQRRLSRVQYRGRA